MGAGKKQAFLWGNVSLQNRKSQLRAVLSSQKVQTIPALVYMILKGTEIWEVGELPPRILLSLSLKDR